VEAARQGSPGEPIPGTAVRSGKIGVMTTEQTEHQTTAHDASEWWHRDHPTFTALAGFFTGMLFVTLIPGGFVGVLRLLFEYDTAEDLFPLVLVSLLVPAGLLIAPRTRRFGLYMVLGMALTALVVLGVASLVLYYLVKHDV
jgi:4-amino-4-deoxy-L-arabinose transferase-like glycosyltransferase